MNSCHRREYSKREGKFNQESRWRIVPYPNVFRQKLEKEKFRQIGDVSTKKKTAVKIIRRRK